MNLKAGTEDRNDRINTSLLSLEMSFPNLLCGSHSRSRFSCVSLHHSSLGIFYYGISLFQILYRKVAVHCRLQQTCTLLFFLFLFLVSHGKELLLSVVWRISINIMIPVSEMVQESGFRAGFRVHDAFSNSGTGWWRTDLLREDRFVSLTPSTVGTFLK